MQTSFARRSLLFSLSSGLVLILGGGGCASSSSLPVYKPGQVNRVQTLETGTVQSVRAVIIEGESGTPRPIGQSVGSSVGRGLAIGADPAMVLAGAAGSVVGSIAGSKVEGRLRQREGQEINVLLDDGTTIVVVQDNNPPFVGGERVQIRRIGSDAEVVPNLPTDDYYADTPIGR